MVEINESKLHSKLRKKAIEFLKEKDVTEIIHEKDMYYYDHEKMNWVRNRIDIIAYKDNIIYLIELETQSTKERISLAMERVGERKYVNVENHTRKGFVFIPKMKNNNIVKLLEV